jgi:2-iminobutanoate/2-iminopropanoate deaminase
VAGGLLFTSMQIPLAPDSGELMGQTAAEQARRCLQNIQAILAAAGASPADVVKVMIYLTDIAEFGPVNEVYARFFPQEPPARGVVEVSALPKGALVAIEAIARTG